MYFNQVIVSSNEQIEYFSSQNDKKKAVHPIMRPPSLLPSRKTYLSIRRMLLTGKPRIHINYIRSTKRQYFNHIFLHTIEYTCFTCNPCIIRRKAFNIFYTKISFLLNGINAEHIQNCIFHFFYFLCVSRHIFALKINFPISLKELSFIAPLEPEFNVCIVVRSFFRESHIHQILFSY